MKIETDEWIRIAEIEEHSSTLKQRTAYRAAASMGLIHEFFGVKCIKRTDVAVLEKHQKRVGNPDWISDYDLASEAAKRAVQSRMKRVAAKGPTPAEVRRNKMISKARAAKR